MDKIKEKIKAKIAAVKAKIAAVKAKIAAIKAAIKAKFQKIVDAIADKFQG